MTLRNLAAGGLLALGTASLGVAAEPEAKSWLDKLTPSLTAEPAPPPPPTFANSTPRLKSVGPLDSVVRLEAVKAEQAACDRRLEVCRKLRQIALANNDDELSREAEDLERQAVALFQQRVARFGGQSGWKQPAEPTAAAPQNAFKVVTP